MRGSLDYPPITIRASPWRIIFLLIFFGLFAGVEMYVLGRPNSSWRNWAGFALFAVLFLFYLRFLVSPPKLVLSMDGVFFFNGLNTAQYSWRDIQDFRTFRKPGLRSGMVPFVGFDFTAAGRGRFPVLENKAVAGVEGSLGAGWEFRAVDVVALLHQARTRWASD